jgi:hypothetical protein
MGNDRGLGQAPAKDGSGSWYGWQTLTADALSIGMITLGASLESPVTMLTGFASLNLAVPVIHFVHGRSSAGWWSGGVRVASTTLLGAGGALVVGDAFDSQYDSGKQTAGSAMAVIGLVGLVAMISVDAVLAIDKDASTDRPTAHLQLIPSMTHGSRGATMQLSLQM